MVVGNPLESTNDKLPDLSVVVVTVYSSWYLEQCLTSLERQVEAQEIEIIAVYDERIDDVSQLKEKFPSVRFHFISGLQTQEKLRAAGTALSQGKIVALTVDHCTPEENWCRRIIDEHTGPYAAVGGALEKGLQPNTAINWAVHFYDYCNYGYYQNPVPRGPARDLSDGNVSYKREALNKVADIWKDSFHVPFVNRALLAKGDKLWLSPEIIVYQNRNIDFGRAVQVAYRRGRVFGSTRVLRAGPYKRVLYTFCSLILPLLLLGRFVMNILYKRSQMAAVAKAFLFIVLLAVLWSVGEFMGYLTGRAIFKSGQTYD
ncbi:MAG: glycosyltransferase family 2 protein [Planctomycetes bacterium]|nr:glycosyltransferase family 2 protein [Planctomycetota bacterium]